MSECILGYRIFADDKQRMNKSVIDIRGEVFLVPQFTLAANTRKGMRPSFSSGVEAEKAENLFLRFVSITTENYAEVKAGHFGTNMQIALVNDGPATFLLRN